MCWIVRRGALSAAGLRSSDPSMLQIQSEASNLDQTEVFDRTIPSRQAAQPYDAIRFSLLSCRIDDAERDANGGSREKDGLSALPDVGARRL